MMTQNDIAAQVRGSYDIIAEHHVRQALESVYNDYYERPAMFSLLGCVEGQRVLDAGCASGSYTEWLVAHGARVLAIDASPRMIHLTKQRMGDAVEVQQADLNEPLNFIEKSSFDIVLCSLVLDYIKDWDTLFSEFSRILTESGRFIFSVHHPYFLDLKVEAQIEDTYFFIQQLEEDWLVFGLKIPAYRRPLGAMSASLWRAGFLIEQIIEPKPTEACKEVHPQHYETLSRHPVFICISARKCRRM